MIRVPGCFNSLDNEVAPVERLAGEPRDEINDFSDFGHFFFFKEIMTQRAVVSNMNMTERTKILVEVVGRKALTSN